MELFLSGSDPQIPYFLEHGPYVPTSIVPAVAATSTTPAAPERTFVKKVSNWTDEDKRLVNVDTKTRSLIAMSLPDEVFHSISKLKIAKEIWDTLCIQYEGVDTLIESKKIHLIRQYEKFNCLLIDLKTYGIVYSNSQGITKFMEALPEYWETYTMCLKMSKDIKTITLSELYGMMLNHEQTKSLKTNLIRDTKDATKGTSLALISDASQPSQTPVSTVTITEIDDSDSDLVSDNEADFNESLALLSKHFKKFGRKGNFRKPKKLSLTNKPDTLSGDKATFTRFKCQGKGHFATECMYKKNQFAESSTPAYKDGKYQKLKSKYRKLKYQRKGRGWDESSDESSDEEDTSEVTCLMAITEEPEPALMAQLEDIPEEEVTATSASTSDLPQEKGIWYLDSGCSKHMTGNKHVLVDFKEEAGPSVKFGGEGRGITRGYGTLTNGKTAFRRVSYVEGLTHNLPSVSQLCDKDHKVSFSKKSCQVKNKHKKVILRGQRSHDVYVINMDTSTENVCFMSRASSEINWLCTNTINQLSISNLVKGLPENSFAKESLCVACEKGKQTRASFKSKQVSTINSPLHLLHMDLFGPVNIQSMGGKRFTLVIVFFLRAKSETPQLIISFILRMEKYNQITVHSIRSDHGTEFKNSVKDEFFVSKGISQNFSSVRTPQQNGVAERRNRTLIEAARSMLIEADLPIQFWAEAVNTACYTQNMSLILKRFKKTAYELIKGRNPNIEYFHIFGCNCYIKNDRDALGKFDAKADDGFLVGYSTISKAYRVFNKRRQTIEETIDVKFDESNPFSSSSPSDNNDVDLWANSYFQVPENEAHDTNIPAAGTPSPFPDGFEEIPEIPQDPPVYSTVPISQVAPTTSQEDIPSTSGSSEAAPLVADPPQLDAVAEESSSTVAAEPLQAVPQPPALRWTRNHPIDQVLGDPSNGVRTRQHARNH
ncbi:hypothetical protein OSB04_028221 [Centaurea solstitialis]|uniref:Integrase catalytic domain-containing protein n=1 Tax=Centaurea solstitialis TaxID=347529 RepID=A0AA38W7I3_9ASTR|nr:hypothetical protein OSB04_028221 [Centaurea solstitialis]